jgi:hypothetical protein
MNATRAAYLLDNPVNFEVRFAFDCPLHTAPFFTGIKRIPITEDGVTKEEYNFIGAIWSMMPPDSCFEDALKVIRGS